MARTEAVELTVMCLLTRGDELLLQNRRRNGWLGWALPGGHIERGESIVEAARREMKEETGLDVNGLTLCGVKQFPIDEGRYIVFLFRSDRFSGTLTSSDEGEMRWFRRSELASIDTADDLIPLIGLMEDDGHSEFRYTVNGSDWSFHIH